nr:MAG TPA: hypothetical protein [Caudoviricetes sp.]
MNFSTFELFNLRKIQLLNFTTYVKSVSCNSVIHNFCG